MSYIYLKCEGKRQPLNLSRPLSASDVLNQGREMEGAAESAKVLVVDRRFVLGG